MRDVIRFLFLALVFSLAAVGCVDSDSHVDDIDRDPSTFGDEQTESSQNSSDDTVTSPPEAVVEAAADSSEGDTSEAGQVTEEDAEQAAPSIALLAGKQPNHPSAWLAHAAANESECGHTSCPYTVEETESRPEAIPPFERGEECMLTGGVAVDDESTFSATAQAGAASANFDTGVLSGEDFVELQLSGQAQADVPTAGGVRSDAGATLYADETALLLDIQNPTGEPVELEVSWDLTGEPVRGEASWQGSLWYTDSASRLDECYVAPDYQYDRVFDVFQDVGGDVRGDASGTVRLPIGGGSAGDERIQVGLRLNVGAHAVGREGSNPALAQDSASRVEGTVRFRLVPAE